MSERNIDDTPAQQSFTAISKETYQEYRSEVFRHLEDEADPGIVDVEASELLILVATHQEFNIFERFQEMASVSHLAMMYLRRFLEPGNKLEVAKHAELIHGAYEQLYAQSVVELAKLSGNKIGSE